MKNIFTCILFLSAISFSSYKLQAATGTATITLRPTYVYIQTDTSQGVMLIKLSGYSSNDLRYRLFNGSSQYACWNRPTQTFITSASYSSGPLALGTPSSSSEFWIVYQRGTNSSTTASYRDRIGPGYSTNNNTLALPSATAITDSFILSGKLRGAFVNKLTEKYVVLAWNGSVLVSATASKLNSGLFSIYLPTGVNIDKIEIRTLENLSIAEVTGSWSTFSVLPDLQLTDKPDQDPKLSAIIVDGKILPEFNPEITQYIIDLPSGTTIIPNIEVTINNPGASFQITPPVDLQGDTTSRKATIVVTALNGITTLTYSILFNLSAQGNDAFLLDIFVNGEAIDGFSPGSLDYSVFLLCGTSAIPVVSFTSSDTAAVVSISNALNLNGTITERTTSLKVTAEDGITQKTYNIQFEIYVPGTNSSLVDLSVNGSTVNEFDPGIYEYGILLPAGTVNVPDISVIASDENATTLITNASGLTGTSEERTTTALVTAEDGTTTSTYKIVFSIYTPGNDALLSDLSVTGNTIPGFSQETFVYHLELPFGSDTIPQTGFLLSDPNASANITIATGLHGTEEERTTTVRVIAEDGITIAAYKLIFTLSIPGTDAFLLDLTINGISVSGFTIGTFEYAVVLPYNTTEIPALGFSKSDPKSNEIVTDATNLTGTESERTSTVLITAEDGITKSNYKIIFTLYIRGTDSFLSDLSLNGTTVNGFTPAKYDYAVILPIGISEIPVISYTISDPKASISVIDASNTDGTLEERTTKLTVTAEDGISSKTYKLTFSRYIPDNNAFIQTLIVNGISPAGFSPEIFSYEMVLPAETMTSPVISFTPAGINTNSVLTNATNIFGTESERTSTIFITAEDGISTLYYKIIFSVYIPGNNAFLLNLSVNCTALENFAGDVFVYEFLLPAGTTRIPVIGFNLNDTRATAVVQNANNLNGNETERTTVISVTAEDGITKAYYKIVFSLDNNNGLSTTPNAGIRVFPVPALNLLTVSGLARVKRLDIIDTKALLLRHVEITGDEINIDISDLQNGIYFLRTESQTLKFIKE